MAFHGVEPSDDGADGRHLVGMAPWIKFVQGYALVHRHHFPGRQLERFSQIRIADVIRRRDHASAGMTVKKVIAHCRFDRTRVGPRSYDGDVLAQSARHGEAVGRTRGAR